VKIDVGFVDTRLTQMDITGQEILTQDKVSLRINFVCNYRVTDYVKILTEIDNFAEQMHVAAQLALREYVGKYKLDEILENKTQVSEFVFAKLKEKEKEIDELKEMLLEKEEKTELLLKQVAKVLAVNTNYATMITAPNAHRNKLKFLQLSRVDKNQILVVVVAEGNIIKNSIVPVGQYLDDETLLKLNILLNTNLNGLSMEEINLGVIAAMKQKAGIHSDLISEVLDAVAEAIKADEDLEIYTSGANNIFKYPELSDNQKASDLITTFEEKRMLNQLVEQSLETSEETGIQVYIGDENSVQSMKDCSVVTATYELGDGLKGTIGIIGPKRMDYEKVVSTLKTMKHQLDRLYKE
jgi:heat-inducible transcriptional repressor